VVRRKRQAVDALRFGTPPKARFDVGAAPALTPNTPNPLDPGAPPRGSRRRAGSKSLRRGAGLNRGQHPRATGPSWKAQGLLRVPARAGPSYCSGEKPLLNTTLQPAYWGGIDLGAVRPSAWPHLVDAAYQTGTGGETSSGPHCRTSQRKESRRADRRNAMAKWVAQELPHFFVGPNGPDSWRVVKGGRAQRLHAPVQHTSRSGAGLPPMIVGSVLSCCPRQRGLNKPLKPTVCWPSKSGLRYAPGPGDGRSGIPSPSWTCPRDDTEPDARRGQPSPRGAVRLFCSSPTPNGRRANGADG